jgi:hypothetical protein
MDMSLYDNYETWIDMQRTGATINEQADRFEKLSLQIHELEMEKLKPEGICKDTKVTAKYFCYPTQFVLSICNGLQLFVGHSIQEWPALPSTKLSSLVTAFHDKLPREIHDIVY